MGDFIADIIADIIIIFLIGSCIFCGGVLIIGIILHIWLFIYYFGGV